MLENKLRKQTVQCISEHAMLKQDDHVLVGLSGGKDSWALLHLLKAIQKKAPYTFTISAVTVDGGLIGLDATELQKQCDALDVDFHLERQAVFEIVSEKKAKGSTFCSMCAKMRRGILYTVAKKLGANKIALGHHLNDAIETLFLNMFYAGRMAAMPPVLKSNAGHEAEIIRPMLYLTEQDIAVFSLEKQFKTVGCACPVCPIHPEFDDAQSDLKRFSMKKVIRDMAKHNPQMFDHARKALKNLEFDRFFMNNSMLTKKGIEYEA
ncbi:tRNA 2-thiocytidine(32) synthetase TtcA [bacterium]|nr:tRNA 2-thiocytidine(32) synthetase TtcA [bacterium]